MISDNLMLNYNRKEHEAEPWNVIILLEFLKGEIETRERTLTFAEKNETINFRFEKKAPIKDQASHNRDIIFLIK